MIASPVTRTARSGAKAPAGQAPGRAGPTQDQPQAPPQDRASRHDETLDALRGVAALAVLLLHTSYYLWPGLARSAYLAVDFFVLSGFVAAHAYDAKLGRGLPVPQFLKLRMIRLWPLHLAGLLIAAVALAPADFHLPAPEVALALALGSLFLPWPFASVPSHLFLLNPPAWSLFLEVLVHEPLRPWLLAAQRAEDEAVREFAEDLLESYEERLAALSDLAGEHGVEPVATLDRVTERRMEVLDGLSGPAFDAECVAGQAPALYGEGWVHRRAAEHVGEAAIREAAAAAVEPTEAHFQTALALAREEDAVDDLHPWDSTALVFGMGIDRSQVALGELARVRSGDERARSFAAFMVDEHSRSFDATAALAAARGVAPVEEPGPVEARVLDHLSGLSGAEFDRDSLDSQVIFDDHWYKRLEFTANNGRDEAATAAAARGQHGGKAHHDAVYGIVAETGG